MKYSWIDEYLMAKRGVTKDLQPEWNWIRYHIGGKMFAAVLLDDDDRPYYINFKLEPLEGELMRGQYPDMIPGYYSDKRNWNSIKADGDIPDNMLKIWLDRSYSLVLRGFSKRKQREALGLSCCGTDCTACPRYGNPCAGCNETCGRVFHAPEGQACPVYACCAGKHRFATCGDCGELPCPVWRSTRDPSLSDEPSPGSAAARVSALKAVK